MKGIREACLVARRILDAGHAAVRPGATTDDIDRVVRPVASVEFCRHAAVVEVWCVVLKQATADCRTLRKIPKPLA